MPELFIAFGILVSILWLVIGWRAMKAHERIAGQLKRYVDGEETRGLTNFRKENSGQHRLYKQFVQENPELESLTSKGRHERFRTWLLERGEPEEGD